MTISGLKSRIEDGSIMLTEQVYKDCYLACDITEPNMLDEIISTGKYYKTMIPAWKPKVLTKEGWWVYETYTPAKEDEYENTHLYFLEVDESALHKLLENNFIKPGMYVYVKMLNADRVIWLKITEDTQILTTRTIQL